MILLFAESVGNHFTFIFDITTLLAIGQHEHKVACAGCSRLNIKTSILSTYNAVLEKNMKVHRMNERQDAVIAEIFDDIL